MRVWLELTQEENDRLFDTVKGFNVDSIQTDTVDRIENEQKKEAANTDKKDKEKPVAIEEIRAVLAEKSQSGKQPEVKALITKYGAKKLTDIDPASYIALLAEAEAL